MVRLGGVYTRSLMFISEERVDLRGDSHYSFATAMSKKRLIVMCSPNYQEIAKLALTGIKILFFTVVVSAAIAQPSLQLTFDSLGPTVEQLR